MTSSEDSYCTRVGRSVREGLGKLAGSYETFERYARRQHARIERLEPPAELDDEHAGLIDLLAKADESANDPSRSLKARAEGTTRSLLRAREQRAALIERRDDAYTKALADVEESSESLIEGAFERAEQAVAGMLEKLERMDPPTELADGHDALVESSRRYLESMQAYHVAIRDLDPERVGTSVNECEQAKAAVKAKLSDICG